ncbi:MAG: glycine zipper 2TM domain-containing protein [Halieaceae bacterium]|jgi:uncharacterized protein YcfJ|nr:glycine zipper 2TM domain-containing protein [Halieaceae bacterium]
MKPIFFVIGMIPAVALAGTNSTVIDAQVESVQPLVEIVTQRIPVETCHEERVRVIERGPERSSAVPTLVGGLVGGTVGRVLGQNSSKRGLITGVGAAVGAAVAHQRASVPDRGNEYYDVEEICSVDYEIREYERVNGYRVSYRFGDKIYTTRTTSDPGETIPVRVELNPLL